MVRPLNMLNGWLACICLAACGGGGTTRDSGLDAADRGVQDSGREDQAIPDAANVDGALLDSRVEDARVDDTGMRDAQMDSRVDASTDASMDASADVGMDASTDAGMDGSMDGGVPDAGSALCPGSTFTIEGREAIDARTGLRWQRFAESGSARCAPGLRLPSVEELAALRTDDGSACGLDTCVFPGENCGVFRSGDPSRSFDFLSGQLVRSPSAFRRTRCVR